MGDVIYTTVPGKIRSLLTKIQEVGIPQKVTGAWLKSIGFTSSNDPTLIGVLRLAGLVDDKSVPTSDWQKFRGSKGAEVLAQGIKAGYSELYGVYPDAHARTNSELEHVFSTSSKAGKQAIQKAVATFKNLAAEADFKNSDVGAEPHIETSELHLPVSGQKPSTQEQPIVAHPRSTSMFKSI